MQSIFQIHLRNSEAQLSLVCIFIALFLSACGTQDYSYDEEKESAEMGQPLSDVGWRDAALKQKNADPQVARGNSSDAERMLGGGISFSENCPEEALCISSPFFGSVQLGKLAAAYPDVFELDGGNDGQVLTIKGVDEVVVQADIIELADGQSLHFCGNELKIFASGIVGDGVISGSAERCGEKRDGANIQILSGSISGVQVISDGIDGQNGKQGSIDWALQAEDGDSDSVRVNSEASYQDLNVCADFWSCADTYKDKIQGSDLAERATAASLWMDEHYEWLESKGLNRSIIEEHIAKAVTAQEKVGAMLPMVTNCFVKSKRGVSNQTGLIKKIKINLSGVEGLNGKDAAFKSEGTNGENGGSSGRIEVVVESSKVPRPIARNGKPGKAGESFAQKPGRGVESKESSYLWSEQFYGWFECLYDFGKWQGGKFVHDIQPIYKVPLDLKLEENLSLAKLTKGVSTDSVLDLKNLRGAGSIRGSDGRPIEVPKTRDGAEGMSYDPSLIVSESLELIEMKAEEFCSTCELPKVFSENL